jgi:phosphoribosyl 1,2-cyclic phosphodiesterase
MLIRFWGTRGSIPSPGAHTVGYGGNTTCIEVITDTGYRLIVDAGTGARLLGAAMVSGASPGRALHLLLSHCHWDHVQGLPFFEPLRRGGLQISVRLPAHLLGQADRILETQLEPLFFPLSLSDMRATVVIDAARKSEHIADVVVRSAAVEHPGGAVAYRIDDPDNPARSVVFAPDSELIEPDKASAGGTPAGGAVASGASPAFAALCAGARILVHDAMYTRDEYDVRRGWGHSTHLAALELAINSGVSALVLFHHHPDRSDDQVDALVAECEAEVARRGVAMSVTAAREGMELEL